MSDQMYFERKPSFYAPYLKYFESKGAVGPLLDMGTGHGHLMQLAIERGIESYGLEYSSSRVEICLNKGLDVLQHDLCTPLPYADSTFGMAYCGQVMEHLPPDCQQMIINEALRVLKPGGVFQIQSPNRNWDKTRMTEGHDYLLTIQELKELLLDAGFVKVDVSINYPQKVPEIPKPALLLIWYLFRPDLLAYTANAICFKPNR